MDEMECKTHSSINFKKREKRKKEMRRSLKRTHLCQKKNEMDRKTHTFPTKRRKRKEKILSLLSKFVVVRD